MGDHLREEGDGHESTIERVSGIDDHLVRIHSGGGGGPMSAGNSSRPFRRNAASAAGRREAANNTIPTRGYAAGLTVLEILAAFEQGDFYDINKLDDSGIIFSSSDEYDQKCPNATDRKVSIRIFKTIAR
jgi:hypothetical protein